ncbi:hypothetical protein ACLOJK_032554 [Asimina triloba]
MEGSEELVPEMIMTKVQGEEESLRECPQQALLLHAQGAEPILTSKKELTQMTFLEPHQTKEGEMGTRRFAKMFIQMALDDGAQCRNNFRHRDLSLVVRQELIEAFD